MPVIPAEIDQILTSLDETPHRLTDRQPENIAFHINSRRDYIRGALAGITVSTETNELR